MRIYITHCSANKDDGLKNTGVSVPPDRLYTGGRTRAFMNRCKSRNVPWAIFSDLYGVWFPTVQHGWYEKSPNRVTPAEFQRLQRDFDSQLERYEEIVFYRHPARFHALYRTLIDGSNLRSRITLISRVVEIV